MSTARKILIVDDDEDLRESLKDQLALHDEFEVFTAGTASKGVEVVKNEHLDLVLLDVGLPDMDGREACKLLRGQLKSNGADGYIIMGSLSHQAAVQRTKDVEDVVGMDMCNFVKITDKQSSEWSRDNANNLMTNWLSTGEVPDVVFANHDDSAIGAILALKAANVPMEDVVVVGVDATADALQAMQAGDLDVTVFQNAKAQGGGGLDIAMKLVKGETVDRVTYIPFELVTPANMADYIGKN